MYVLNYFGSQHVTSIETKTTNNRHWAGWKCFVCLLRLLVRHAHCTRVTSLFKLWWGTHIMQLEDCQSDLNVFEQCLNIRSGGWEEGSHVISSRRLLFAQWSDSFKYHSIQYASQSKVFHKFSLLNNHTAILSRWQHTTAKTSEGLLLVWKLCNGK